MHSTLAQLRQQMNHALSGLEVEALRHHPSDDRHRWCIEQIVEHLMMSYQSTCRSLERRLRKDRPTRTPLTWTHRAKQAVVVSLRYFPDGRQAPAIVWPPEEPSGKNGTQLAAEFSERLDEMEDLLCRCEQKFSGQRLETHFLLGPMRAGQWRIFHAVHGQHHLRQIERLKAEARSLARKFD